MDTETDCDDLDLTPDPTPEEIRLRAARIREGWTEDDYRQRAGVARRFEFSKVSLDRLAADR